MRISSLNQLDNFQLETFDTEYVNDDRWLIIKSALDKDFPTGEFSFIDIGGGNGNFADRVLEAYPGSVGTVLDNSNLLLGRNKQHSRKQLICESAGNLSSFTTAKYDIVFLNWVLHHLVSSSYVETRSNISATLEGCQSLLSPDGRISIFENMYNGLWADGLSGYLVYHLTSSKLISRLTRKWANTAGVGVCFLSCKQWGKTISDSGLSTLYYTNDAIWKIPLAWNLLLHIGHIRCGHFWVMRKV